MCELTEYNLLEDKDLISLIVSERAADHFLNNSYDLEEILLKAEPEELLNISGIGPKKLEELRAIRESIRRLFNSSREKAITIGSPIAIMEMNKDMAHLDQEEIRIVMLNVKNRVIGVKTITKGTISRSLVSPKEIFSPAVRKMAAGIVMVHNHPSGIVEPSSEDKKITEKVKEAGDVLSISLVDSIIIGKNGFYSFKEEGELIW